MKHFTDADVDERGRIYCSREDLEYAPTKRMLEGLQETASGYGARLNSGLKISFNGQMYRIYVTIFSNCGTSWFIAKGRKIIVG